MDDGWLDEDGDTQERLFVEVTYKDVQTKEEYTTNIDELYTKEVIDMCFNYSNSNKIHQEVVEIEIREEETKEELKESDWNNNNFIIEEDSNKKLTRSQVFNENYYTEEDIDGLSNSIKKVIVDNQTQHINVSKHNYS